MDKNFVQRLFTLYCEPLFNCFKNVLERNHFEQQQKLKKKIESTVEIKLKMKFYPCVFRVSLTLEIYFLKFPLEIVYTISS